MLPVLVSCVLKTPLFCSSVESGAADRQATEVAKHGKASKEGSRPMHRSSPELHATYNQSWIPAQGSLAWAHPLGNAWRRHAL